MSCTLIALLGLGALAAGAYGLYALLARGPDDAAPSGPGLSAALRRCAGAVGGTLDRGEGPLPTLRYALGASQAVLQLQGVYGPARLDYSLPFYLPPVFCLRPAGAPPTMFGRGQIDRTNTHDPAFDAAYVVRTNNPGFVERALTDDMRQALLSLPQLLHPNSSRLSITLGANVLRIEAPVLVPDHADLETFVRRCDSFARVVFSSLGHPVGADAGVAIVEAGPVQLSEGSCRVCGEAIRARPVLCRRCRTPHHKECWEYFGSCAIFACNSREHVTE